MYNPITFLIIIIFRFAILLFCSDKPESSKCSTNGPVVPDGEPADEHDYNETGQQGETKREQSAAWYVSSLLVF